MRLLKMVLLATDDDDIAAELGLALRKAGLGVAYMPTVAQTMARLAMCQRPVQVLLLDARLAGGRSLDALRVWVEWIHRPLPRVIFWADDSVRECVGDHLSFLIDIQAHQMALPLDPTALGGLAFQFASEDESDLWYWSRVIQCAGSCPLRRPHPWWPRPR